MKKYTRYARVIKLLKIEKEPCQSGLTYLFAKEAGASKPLGGSNPPGSAGGNVLTHISKDSNDGV